jgi:hypothetical protein
MRVLIAVNQQRRVHEHHPSEAVDGELVTPVLLECADPERCRCSRSWAGLSTTGFSGLAEVAERPNLSRADLREAIHDLLDEVGWIDEAVQLTDAGEFTLDGVVIDDPVWAAEAMIDDHLAQIDVICSTFPVGSVLSRLGDLVAPTVESQAA